MFKLEKYISRVMKNVDDHGLRVKNQRVPLGNVQKDQLKLNQKKVKQ